MKIFDYLVVGSGCSGAMVAQTLHEYGQEILMLDVGYTSREPNVPPGKDFLTLRRTDSNQHRYLLGHQLEELDWEEIGKGAQITPGRRHINQSVDKYLPIRSSTFSPLESLGYGGLGIGWGLQCWEYSQADLQAVGLDPDRTIAAYEVISRRIGISAKRDNAATYTLGQLKTFQPATRMDRNHQRIYQKYQHHQKYFAQRGFIMGRTPLALLTKPLGKRQAYAYTDTDYYSDHGQSAWRPWMTINYLKRRAGFTYCPNQLVISFEEGSRTVKVHSLDVRTHQPATFKCRRLILATGALGTARIVLRSAAKRQQLPLLCNPYTYIPCLQPALFGKPAEAHKLGFAQLSLFFDESEKQFETSVASLYSYQSLMMFRIIRQLGLNFADSRRLLQYLMPGLIIMGVHHPDSPSPQKYLRLHKSTHTVTGDILKAHYTLDAVTMQKWNKREKHFIKMVRKLGLYGVKRLNPGYGSSIHYAGTLPYNSTEKPLSLSPTGRLHGTRHIYVADSSGFRYLPAQGLTFTLMANAHVITESMLRYGH